MELLHFLPAIPAELQGYIVIAAVLLYLGRLIKKDRSERLAASIAKQGRRIGSLEQAQRVERVARLQVQYNTNRVVDALRLQGFDVPAAVTLAEVIDQAPPVEQTSTEIPPLPAQRARHATREDPPA